MKAVLLALLGSLVVSGTASAADALPPGAKAVLDLWPGVAPGSETWTRKETITPFVFEGRTVPVTRNVVKPTLTVYLPEPSKATGAAAVIAPGGAFRHVTMDSEGYDVARWLASRGIAGFVLKYRVVETPADDAGYKRAMDELTASIRDPKATRLRMRGDDAKYAIADGIQAHQLVRAHAKEWGIDPERIGMIGFSAGAALTTGVMLEPGAPRLAFAAPIYGGPIDPTAALPAKLPPVFLAVAQNDFVRANVFAFNDALQAGKHDSELHLFASGGHGFGLIHQGKTSDHWIDELYWWLQAKGVVKAFAAESGAPPFDPAVMRAEIEAYRKKPDTQGTGHYPAIKEEVASLPNHTIYRPADLTKLGTANLGVLVFGNGGCAADGAGARFHLSEIASHGYLAIASGKILSGPGAPPNPPPATPPLPKPGEPRTLPPPATKTVLLREAIDWALAENVRQGSPYYGRIDPKAIATSGWSCGGLQALQVAAEDPRVATSVIHNSGIWASSTRPEGGQLPAEMDLGKGTLGKLHGSVIYILGGPTDIAYANGMDDFKRIEHVKAMTANTEVGHQGTFLQPNGGIAAQLAVKWLDWQLKGDAEAAKYFTGKDCGACKDAAWKIERKGF